jgi:hypothetical protein
MIRRKSFFPFIACSFLKMSARIRRVRKGAPQHGIGCVAGIHNTEVARLKQ